MKYIYIYTFMYYYQTQREVFFVSGNDHMWLEIGVRALFIAYLVHTGPTNIFMVRGLSHGGLQEFCGISVMNGTDGSYLLDSYGYQSTCSGKKN